jgi:hypothetical protein
MQERAESLNKWSLGFNEETAVPPKPSLYPGPLCQTTMERYIIEENSWNLEIHDFQQKSINRIEEEAEREVFDLQANVLREHHARHLRSGSFSFDPNL